MSFLQLDPFEKPPQVSDKKINQLSVKFKKNKLGLVIEVISTTLNLKIKIGRVKMVFSYKYDILADEKDTFQETEGNTWPRELF